MIIYNVTIKVNQDIVEDWLRWMKEEHMPELLQTGIFTESRLCRLLDQDETEGATFSAQYTCDSQEDYEEYIRSHAPIMREKGLKKFGNKFIAFRSVMAVES